MLKVPQTGNHLKILALALSSTRRRVEFALLSPLPILGSSESERGGRGCLFRRNACSPQLPVAALICYRFSSYLRRLIHTAHVELFVKRRQCQLADRNAASQHFIEWSPDNTLNNPVNNRPCERCLKQTSRNCRSLKKK